MRKTGGVRSGFYAAYFTLEREVDRFVLLPMITAATAAVLAPLIWGLAAGPGFLVAAFILLAVGWAYFISAGLIYGLLAGLIPDKKFEDIIRDAAPVQIVVAIGIGVISGVASGTAYVNIENEWQAGRVVIISGVLGALCGPILWIFVRKVRSSRHPAHSRTGGQL